MDAKEITSLKAGETLWDRGTRDAVSGLHVRAFKSKKVFYLFYRTQAGIQRKPKLGAFPVLSITQAREIAMGYLADVARGVDPSRSRKELRAEVTLNEVFKKIWDEYWDAPRFKQSGWGQEVWSNYHNNIGPDFGSRKLSDLSASEIRNWHNGFKEKPYAGNRSLEILSRIFNYCEEQEWRAQHTNPCTLINAHPERKRKRFATRLEIQNVGEALMARATSHPKEVAFILLLIFCGPRPRAIERAKRSQLKTFIHENQVWGVLTFKGKTSEATGEEERVLLPPQVMKIIEALPAPADGSLLGIKKPARFWREVRSEAGCVDLWARDWRRTFASVGLSNGVTIGVVGELLNHQSTETTKVYAKLFDEERLKAVSMIANILESNLYPNTRTMIGS